MAELAVCVYFTGQVQGVGFRFKTVQVAAGFAVSGFVQNLVDGRVKAHVEGETQDVQAFLTALEERMQSYINSSDRQIVKAEQLEGFTIRE